MKKGAPWVLSALMAWALVAVQACGDPCEVGASRCEGKSLRTCGHACEDCDLDWLPAVACEGACIVESEKQAFCSIRESPDPLCDGRRGYCAADLQINCRNGYATSQIRCEPPPGTSGTTKCVEFASGFACSTTGMGPPDGGKAD